jgi:hypothetical protein
MYTKILAVPLVLLAFGCRDRYEGQAGAASSPGASPYAEATASPGTGLGTGAGITATVVAVDATGMTVTLREAPVAGAAPTGDTAGRRYNVSSSVASSLNNIQAGDEVTVVCDQGAGSTAGSTGAGSGMGSTGAGSGTGSLATCTTITSITETGGATGR